MLVTAIGEDIIPGITRGTVLTGIVHFVGAGAGEDIIPIGILRGIMTGTGVHHMAGAGVDTMAATMVDIMVVTMVAAIGETDTIATTTDHLTVISMEGQQWHPVQTVLQAAIVLQERVHKYQQAGEGYLLPAAPTPEALQYAAVTIRGAVRL